MRDRINVKKELIPYGFNITLGREVFNLRFQYNAKADLFTCTLRKNDEVLCYGEPLVYGRPLFRDIYESGKFPMVDIVPLDESGEESEVTWENFGKTVFLTLQNGVK